MRILQVIPALESGGVERCVLEISDYLISEGHDVFVMSKGGWMKMLLNKKCAHIDCKIGSKNIFKIIKNARFIKKFCEDNKIDLVHVHSRAPAWACYLAWKRSNFKLVTTVHGAYSTKGIFKKWYNSVMLRSDCVIAVSDFIKNYIAQEYNCNMQNVHVVPRGVDLNLFCPGKVSNERVAKMANDLQIMYDKYIITVPARITEIKGHEYLLEAVAMIKSKNYMCLFVGDWHGKLKYKTKLEAKIKTLNLEANVRFTGGVKDMSALYLLSDLVILPSIKPESFGKVIIEAGAMGCVILSTNIGTPKDNIFEGVNGFLVPPKNAMAMSTKILEIMQSERHKDAEYKAHTSAYFRDKFNVMVTCKAECGMYQRLCNKAS